MFVTVRRLFTNFTLSIFKICIFGFVTQNYLKQILGGINQKKITLTINTFNNEFKYIHFLAN